ncbi:MAG TPA: RES family NAD+ phosphorylase [Candidatus Cybelea sp.]|jgi:RES domain-containing protein
MADRPARDPDLLDKIDALARVEYTGTAWRVVRDGREPLQPSRIGGRWDMGANDVLYTSLDSDGAIAEIHFRLNQEPVFPSRFKAVLYKLHVSIAEIVRFDDVEELRPLGVDIDRYRRVLDDRTQAIGDAAQFLGRKAIIAPNARWPCLNLVLYEIDPKAIVILDRERVDWKRWRTRTAAVRRERRRE